ncbi:hypothetical protein [Peptococcus niger]|nr:hypothetical protein [Peptococcus niger]
MKIIEKIIRYVADNMTVITMGTAFLVKVGCISNFEQQLYCVLVCIGFGNIYVVACEELLNNIKLRNQGGSFKSPIKTSFSESKKAKQDRARKKESSAQSLQKISSVAIQYIEAAFLPFIFILMGDVHKNEYKIIILSIVVFMLWVLLRFLSKDSNKNKYTKIRFVFLLLAVLIFGCVVREVNHKISRVFIILAFLIGLCKLCRAKDA